MIETWSSWELTLPALTYVLHFKPIKILPFGLSMYTELTTDCKYWWDQDLSSLLYSQETKTAEVLARTCTHSRTLGWDKEFKENNTVYNYLSLLCIKAQKKSAIKRFSHPLKSTANPQEISSGRLETGSLSCDNSNYKPCDALLHPTLSF